MDKDHLRTGDKASCLFRFIKSPEYLHADSRMVFREGRTKAIGTITKIHPYVPGSGSGVSISGGAAHSTKKKPSQMPKTLSGGSVSRVKGRRGRGRNYHHIDKTSSSTSAAGTVGMSLEGPSTSDHKQTLNTN